MVAITGGAADTWLVEIRGAVGRPTAHRTALHSPTTKMAHPQLSTVPRLRNCVGGCVPYELEIRSNWEMCSMCKGSVCTEEMGPPNPGWANTLQSARLLQLWLSVIQDQGNGPDGPRWAQMQSQATWMPNEGAHSPGGCTMGGQRRETEGATLLEALLSGLAAGTLIQVCSSLPRPGCRGGGSPAPPHL